MRYRCERVIQLDVGGQRGLWWCCDLLTCRLARDEHPVDAVEWARNGAHVAEFGFLPSRDAESECASAIACPNAFRVVDRVGVDARGGK